VKYIDAVSLYKSSSWFSSLASKTQSDYLYYLGYMGSILPSTINEVTPLLADRIYTKVKAERGERTAIYVCSVMRRLWNFLYRMEKTGTVPWAQMGIASTLKAREVVWTKAQVEAVIEASEAPLALFIALLYDSAQRPSDILALRWWNIQGNVLKVEQDKTGAVVSVPLGKLSKSLLTGGCSDDYVIKTKTGLKYHLTNLRQELTIVKSALGLPKELQLRDLRRTALTEMGDAGCTEDEIMAVSGHKSRQVVSVYVQKTDQQAINAVNKRGN
jgi:integrase